MDKPQDIRQLPWNRRPSDAWTDAAFRAPVIAFMVGFVAGHSWVETGAWDATERFTSTSAEARGLGWSSIEVKVPRKSPVQPAEVADFKQRTGVRILVLGVIRMRDQRRFEVALTFPAGSFTTATAIDTLLGHARFALEAEHKRNPPPSKT
jgi:hypothetical protein